MELVCARGHENSVGAAFCSTCGDPIPPAADPDASPELELHGREVQKRFSIASREGHRPIWVIGGAAAGLLALAAVALVFGLRAWEDRQQANTWKEASAKVGESAEVNGAVLTFSGTAKTDCDMDDYETTEWSGTYSYETTDWDAYERCQEAADLVFAVATMAVFEDVEKFGKQIGLPGSFVTKLENLRGLDGSQTSTMAETKVGTVEATYSYDGGNGLFVQLERKN